MSVTDDIDRPIFWPMIPKDLCNVRKVHISFGNTHLNENKLHALFLFPDENNLAASL